MKTKKVQNSGPNSHKAQTSGTSKQTIAIIVTAVVAIVLGAFVIGSFVSQPSGETVAIVNGKDIKIENPTTLLESATGINKISDKIDLVALQARYGNIDTSSVGTTIDSFKSTYGNDYLTTAEQIIGYPITSEQDIRDYLTLSLYTEELFQEFVPVTDEQIQTAFTETYANEVCARHILIEDETQAQTVLDAITAGTYTVEEVVADKTIVGEEITIKEASDLSCFKKGQMVAEFEAAAFALEKGATSTELVKTDYGYHIINVYDQKANELTDELKETIASDLRSAEKTRANYQTFMTDIREEAGVEITNEAVKTAYDELMTSLTTPAE